MVTPPYPADTRAKGWRFELDYERIRSSDTWAVTPADLRPWLLMLWMVAWEQTPCGALPDDDELICARLGMTPKAYGKAKDNLLRGWTKAEDGRLYHGTITERVLEMIERREKEAGRKRKQRGQPKESPGSPTDGPRDTIGTDGTGTSTSNTVAKATGAAAPVPDAIWGDGLAYLVACGVKETGARSFIGKMRSELKNDLLVAELLMKAEKQQVADPVAWLRKAGGRMLHDGRTAGVAL